MKLSDQFLAYLLLRLTLGLNFVFHAIPRMLNGVGAFRDKMVADFADTPLPTPLIYMFGSAISYVELIIGLLLTLGLFTRATLLAGGSVVIFLMLGKSFQQQWDVVSQQLLYTLLFFILLWTRHANLYSVDRLVRGRD